LFLKYLSCTDWAFRATSRDLYEKKYFKAKADLIPNTFQQPLLTIESLALLTRFSQ